MCLKPYQYIKIRLINKVVIQLNSIHGQEGISHYMVKNNINKSKCALSTSVLFHFYNTSSYSVIWKEKRILV